MRFTGLMLAGLGLAGVVVPVQGQTVDPPLALVPAADFQPGGPEHDYQIGAFEVTNAEFAAFLNDALVNLDNERGSWLYHDTSTADVYLHTDFTGCISTNGPVGSNGLPALVFQAAAGAAIMWDSNGYVVEPGREDHPVVGLSWIGAAKFCNWLTLDWGMWPTQRVYGEGPAAADWEPVAAAADVVAAHNGFRLPLDGGLSGTGQFNEWYKAAAWRVDLGLNALYGFGRDILTSRDANYLASDDPFEPGSTPVGFYDGVNVLTGSILTLSTDNSYGLFDLTGNVAEWVHDRYLSGDATTRAVRGGSWRNAGSGSSLRCTGRWADYVEATRDYVGLRVARSLLGDGLALSPNQETAACGLEGGPFALVAGGPGAPGSPDPTYTLALEVTTNGTPRRYTVSAAVAWVDVNTAGLVEGVLSPRAPEAALVVGVNSNALALATVGNEPHLPMELISTASVQPGGPGYSLWIGKYEVSNADYAEFLNDALLHTGDTRGQYLYHDTDSGDVYLYANATGVVGTNGSGLRVYCRTCGGRIGFDVASNGYRVDAGFSAYPVVGVSWYGAVKFCNWLTLAEGLDSGERAYSEGPHAGDWRPAVISTLAWWGTSDTASHPAPLAGARDLIASERQILVTDYRGYRLPLDGDAGVAAGYGEWHEAAAWLPEVGTNALYGFGRDELAPADAAYAGTNGPRPGGYFNGINLLDDGTPTAAGSSGFGLDDVSGNVREWMQDRQVDSNGLDVGGNARRVRGGSWFDGAESLRNEAFALLDPGAADAFTGLRIVRAGEDRLGRIDFEDELLGEVQTRNVRLHVAPALRWTPHLDREASAWWGHIPTPQAWATELVNASQAAVDFTVNVDQSWVRIDGGTGLTGVIAASSTQPVSIELGTAAAALAPGRHTAVVTLTNTDTGWSAHRTIRLNVVEVLAVAPGAGCEFAALYWGTVPSGRSTVYTLANLGTLPVSWQVTSTANWTSLNGASSAAGTLDAAPDADVVTVSVNSAAASLTVGLHTGVVSFRNTGSGTTHTRQVSLTILDPLEMADALGLYSAGDAGGPFEPAEREYTLTNRGIVPVDWSAARDVVWLDLNGAATAAGALSPGFADTLTVSINAQAAALPGGVHNGAVTITDLQTGATQQRPVTLTVDEHLRVVPNAEAETVFTGPRAGPFLPSRATFTVSNQGTVALPWRAAVQDEVAWLRVNNADQVEGILAAGASAVVVASVDAAAAVGLAAGTHTADIDFVNLADGMGNTSRSVVLEIVDPLNQVDMVTIPAAAVQPGGPDHTFTMSATEISNAEFVRFLNDAYAPQNRTAPRGQYLYHDVDSGDVYVNSVAAGAAGTTGSGTKIFAAATGGAISFDAGSGAYVVSTGLSDRPVVGVSWYGAVKYCNWLTLDRGLPVGQQTCGEGPASDLEAWRPVVITRTNWLTRDLNDGERATLVGTYAGVRLPMDDGRNNSDPARDAADAYNEWYKAAAWNTKLAANTTYAFGRNTVSGADANYKDSGDPFDNGSAPVGYYDGSDHGGSFATNANSNSFGLLDMSGNVMEWVQDKYSTATNRAVRGGSYLSTSGQLPWIENDGRRVSSPATATNALIGFRVVATLPVAWMAGDADADGDVDQADFTALEGCLTGPGTMNVTEECAPFDFDFDADVDLADWAGFTAAWTGA